jgi:hypothetical protein
LSKREKNNVYTKERDKEGQGVVPRTRLLAALGHCCVANKNDIQTRILTCCKMKWQESFLTINNSQGVVFIADQQLDGL